MNSDVIFAIQECLYLMYVNTFNLISSPEPPWVGGTKF